MRKREKQKKIKCGKEINRIKGSEKDKNRRKEHEKERETEESDKAKETEDKKLRGQQNRTK
jgi:hypothetical protein